MKMSKIQSGELAGRSVNSTEEGSTTLRFLTDAEKTALIVVAQRENQAVSSDSMSSPADSQTHDVPGDAYVPPHLMPPDYRTLLNPTELTVQTGYGDNGGPVFVRSPLPEGDLSSLGAVMKTSTQSVLFLGRGGGLSSGTAVIVGRIELDGGGYRYLCMTCDHITDPDRTNQYTDPKDPSYPAWSVNDDLENDSRQNLRVTTPDGEAYPIEIIADGTVSTDGPFPDVSLVSFTSDKEYEIPPVGAIPGAEEPIYVAGWTDHFPGLPGLYNLGSAIGLDPTKPNIPNTALYVDRGQVAHQFSRPLRDGATHAVTALSFPGMSGGALLGENGEIVGLLYRAYISATDQSLPDWHGADPDKYQDHYQDGAVVPQDSGDGEALYQRTLVIDFKSVLLHALLETLPEEDRTLINQALGRL
jgi:Trypsin-like peptidase domain